MNNSDQRFNGLIFTPETIGDKKADVVIIGVPTDEGIRRNGGRIGASHAPHAIRSFLGKLTPNFSINAPSASGVAILDVGDAVGDSLEAMHDNAKELVGKYCNDLTTIIALGGGHDVTYPLASAFSECINSSEFSLINIDAHLDVRPKKEGLHHSGSSFRLLIEEGYLHGQNFTEFGVQPFAYSKEHLDWVTDKGAAIHFFNDLLDQKSAIRQFRESIEASGNPHYISFDIDSIRSSDAPGCSAPSPIGFTAEEAIEMSYISGKNPTTRFFDIVEVSPGYDFDGRTCRLAARMVAAYITGIASR
jgi:formiminoglutamase